MFKWPPLTRSRHFAEPSHNKTMTQEPKKNRLPHILSLAGILMLGASSEHCSWRMSSGVATGQSQPEEHDSRDDAPEGRPTVDEWAKMDTRTPVPVMTEEEKETARRRMTVRREGGVWDEDGDGNPEFVVAVRPDGTKSIMTPTISGWDVMEFSKDGEILIDGRTLSSQVPTYPTREVSRVVDNGKLVSITVESDTDSDGRWDRRTTFDLLHATTNSWAVDANTGDWTRTGGVDDPLPLHHENSSLILRECKADTRDCKPVKNDEETKDRLKELMSNFPITDTVPPVPGRKLIPRNMFEEILPSSIEMPTLLALKAGNDFGCSVTEVGKIRKAYSTISSTASGCFRELNDGLYNRFVERLGTRDVLVFCVETEVTDRGLLGGTSPTHPSILLFTASFIDGNPIEYLSTTILHELIHQTEGAHSCEFGDVKERPEEGPGADHIYACSRFCSRFPMSYVGNRVPIYPKYRQRSLASVGASGIGARFCGNPLGNHAGSDDQAWDCARCADSMHDVNCGSKITPANRLRRAPCGLNKCPAEDGKSYAPLECLQYSQTTCDEHRLTRLVDDDINDPMDICVNVCDPQQEVIAGFGLCALPYGFSAFLSFSKGYCEDPDYCPRHREALNLLAMGKSPKNEARCDPP